MGSVLATSRRHLGFLGRCSGQLAAWSEELWGSSVSCTLAKCQGLSGCPWDRTSVSPTKLPVALKRGVLTQYHKSGFSLLSVVRSSSRSLRPRGGTKWAAGTHGDGLCSQREPWGRRHTHLVLQTQWVRAVGSGGSGGVWMELSRSALRRSPLFGTCPPFGCVSACQ